MQTSVTGREGVRRRHEEQTLSSKWGRRGATQEGAHSRREDVGSRAQTG